MAQYRALVGIDYPPNKRIEAGDVVDDLPGKSIKWLVDGGYIESADKSSQTAPVEEAPIEEAPAVEETPAPASVAAPAEAPVDSEVVN
jgi:hypothetical protein